VKTLRSRRGFTRGERRLEEIAWVLFLVMLALGAFGILGGLVISKFLFFLILVAVAIPVIRGHTRPP